MKCSKPIVIIMMTSLYSNVEAGLRQVKWNVTPTIDRSAFTHETTNNVTEEDIIHFKNCYSLSNDTEIEPQEMSSSNTLHCQGKTYAIDDINIKLQIFTENATCWHDGILHEIPESNIYQKEDTEEIITVVKNLLEEVESVTISNKISRETVSLYNISPKYPHAFAEIKEKDYDFNKLNRKLHYDESQEHYNAGRHLSHSIQSQSKQRKTEVVCSSYKVVNLAVAYESSFCKHYGGKDAAVQKVKSIIAGVNHKFKTLTCIKVELSYLEGYCNPNIDPYNKLRLNLSGCGNNDGLLDDVQEYWNKNKKNVPRDAMHLFSGTGFEGNKNACATTGTICDKNKAYGVNHMTHTESVDLQAVLVAHGLGHNLGAGHYDEELGFIMNNIIGSGSKGFSDESIKAMDFVIKRTSCIREAQPTSSPTNFPFSVQETKSGRVFVDINNIVAPGTSENERTMILVVEDATNAAIDDEKITMIINDHKLEKINTEDKSYKYSFDVYFTIRCSSDCDINKEFEEFITKNVERNFDAAMRKAADDHEVKHLFKDATVNMDSFVYTSAVLSGTFPPSSSLSPSSSPITSSPTTIWRLPQSPECRNTLQSLIKRFLSR